MILNEFELDMPYVEDKVSIEKIMLNTKTTFQEAKIKHYNENWKSKRREFSLTTTCITDMFSRLFKMKTDDCRKIVVECVEVIIDDRILNLMSVLQVQVRFNYLHYLSLSMYEKKVYSLNLLMEGIKKIVILHELDLNPFLIVEEMIKKENYINHWVYKIKNSPNKKLLAFVECFHEVDKFTIKFLLKDINNVIIKEKIIVVLPNRYSYSEYLGNLEWVSDEEVHLLNYNKSEYISLRI